MYQYATFCVVRFGSKTANVDNPFSIDLHGFWRWPVSSVALCSRAGLVARIGLQPGLSVPEVRFLLNVHHHPEHLPTGQIHSELPAPFCASGDTAFPY